MVRPVRAVLDARRGAVSTHRLRREDAVDVVEAGVLDDDVERARGLDLLHADDRFGAARRLEHVAEDDVRRVRELACDINVNRTR